MVLVHVHAFQFQGFTIQKKTPFGIEGDIADARGGLVDIRHLTLLSDSGLNLIQIGVGGTPQMWLIDDDALSGRQGLLGFQREGRHLTLSDFVSFSIEQALRHLTLLRFQTAVGHLGLYRQFRL